MYQVLLSWDSVYRIVKWYVEVNGTTDFQVPSYQDSSPQVKQSYDITEIEKRLKELEGLLIISIQGPIIGTGYGI